MTQIKCRACEMHPKGKGCGTCGGYRFLLELIPVCSDCKVMGWVRPGVYSSYDGRMWKTFDGIDMVDYSDGRVCSGCDAR